MVKQDDTASDDYLQRHAFDTKNANDRTNHWRFFYDNTPKTNGFSSLILNHKIQIKMKNLFFLAITLFITNGCINQPNNNGAEKNTVTETTAVALKDTPSVSADQNRFFDPPKQSTVKKKSEKRQCALPALIIVDSTPPQNSIVDKIPTKTFSKSISPKKSQFFTCKTNVETVLQGAEGITLTIPPDCFETETGDILRGGVRIELKEFLKTSDMILGNLVTQSDDKLLETGGMIYLNATDSEGNAVKMSSDKNIKITLPKAPNAVEKQLFYGDKLPNGRINWTLPKQIEYNINMQNLTIVEQNPEYPDGQAALFKFIQKQMIYPNLARQNNVQGTVYIGFTVLKDGSLGNINLIRGIGYGCNEEAIRIIRKMPRWKPGRSRGQYAPVSYTLPILFNLKNATKQTPENVLLDSTFQEQDTAYVNKYDDIQAAKMAVMFTQKLGWINCDRFLNLQNTQRTDFVVWHNKPDAEIYLVFKNYRTIVGAWSSSEKKVQFTGIPVGQPVFIVATSPEGNQFNISVTETIVSNESATIELKTVEKEAFIHELHRLDIFNK